MRAEEIRAITKVSAHPRPKKGHRKETVHENIRQYTISQDSQQLQQARHSVWMELHAGRVSGCADDQGGQTNKVRGSLQAGAPKEAGDGDPFFGVTREAGKLAAAYTGWRESTGSVRAGGPYGHGLAT